MVFRSVIEEMLLLILHCYTSRNSFPKEGIRLYFTSISIETQPKRMTLKLQIILTKILHLERFI